MPAASIAYNSLTISTGEVTFAGSAIITLLLGGNPDVDFLITGGGGILHLSTNINITVIAGSSANISGEFFIENGSDYNTAGLNTITSVFGTVNNAGTITTAVAGNLLFNDFTAYVHNQDGGVIPTASWTPSSNCIITGLINTNIVSGDGQAFGNLSYNCPGMTGVITMASGVTIAGNFDVSSTGSSQLQMTAGSITVGGEFTLNGAFIVSGATDRTLTVTDNIIIAGGGNLNLCSGGTGNVGTLNAESNFTNFGVITETGTGTGVINFNGTAPQILNQSGLLLNNVNVNIDNSTGVTFSNSITIHGTLTLTNGILTIPVNNTLTIENGNVIGGSGFGAARHIATQVSTGTGAKGFLRINNMAASTPYLAPVGNGTLYLPVTLTPANINGFDICVFNGMTNDGEPNGTPFTAGQKLNIVDAVWTVNLVSGAAGAGVNMTLGWPASLEGATFSTFTSPKIGIAHWDNPNWGNSTGSGDNTANTATRPGVTLFSPFGVGKTPYILPVKFSYLNVAKGNGFNTLNWKAACNSAEVTFTIERSTDGRNYNAINSITATQARCAQPFNYVDNNSLSGTVFYRIKSVEISGLVTYSTIVKVSGQQTDMQITSVLPNPVINQAELSISTSKKDQVELLIVSMDGKVLQRSSVLIGAGSSIISLDVATLQKGIYMIKGTFSNGQTNTLKFIKN